MSFGGLKLGGVSLSQREQLASSAKLLLLWVAASDGSFEKSELEFAFSQFPDAEAAVGTNELLALIEKGDLRSIETAIRTMAAESRELRNAFLDLAITMSMADRRMAITENHTLRFYADALFIGLGQLRKRFRAITGAELAEPGDPSSEKWWNRVLGGTGADDRSEESSESEGEDGEADDSPAESMSREEARHVLQLDQNATRAEIEDAYQRQSALARVDRDEAIREEDVSAANERLSEIERAHELLAGRDR